MLRLPLREARHYHLLLKSTKSSYARQPQTQPSRAFTASRLLLNDSNSDEPKVTWYEQLHPGSSKRQRVDPNNLDVDLNNETKRLKRQISQLEDELNEMEDPQGKTLIEPLIASLSPKHQRRARDAIRKEELDAKRKGDELAKVKRKLAESIPTKSELEILCRLPREKKEYLRILNREIRNAASTLQNPDFRRRVRKAYALCKANFPQFLHQIPEKAWTVLWETHRSISTEDLKWAGRLVTLSKDMLSVGRRLDYHQQTLYIEGLQLDGRQDEAIYQWQQLEGDIGEDQQAKAEYELLGVRIFASNGDPERAEKIALEFLRPERSEDSRVLIPILNLWAQRGDAIGLKHAWALYLRFKAQVGDSMTIEDYDNIIMGLLRAEKTDLALAVFKDMMLPKEQISQESLALYVKAASHIGKSHANAIIPADLNKIPWTGLIPLPAMYQNKFFYAKLLKRLIGMGQVDFAVSVIQLMYERGIRPDAKHLNGIVGACLRIGTRTVTEKAEKMAWAMIDRRLDFVKRRKHRDPSSTLTMSGISDMPSTEDVTAIPPPRSIIPQGTIETFALLLQHYARRARYDKVEEMQKCLAMAEISPNSYFINHLLYADLRKGQHLLAWERYERMFQETRPDLETFACLWDCARAHLNKPLIKAKDTFPEPRVLLSHMMTWHSGLKDVENLMVQEDFRREIYYQIIHCFRLSTDLEGIIVALYSLKEKFGMYPDIATVQMVMNSVVRMANGHDQRTVGRVRQGDPRRKLMTSRVRQIFASMTKQRTAYLAEAGLNPLRRYDPLIEKEERLFKLAEFLRATLRTSTADEGAVEAGIQRAAAVSGVAGLRMDDPIRFYGL
ncbi:hypothetical protein BDR22DRAFT_856192 [Usnea florida]